jgi:single-strand DNA-binding protein
MYSVNKVQIIGNVVRNPEIKTTINGREVCTIGVATNRFWRDSDGEKQEEVEFHYVTAWGNLAKDCEKYLKKGTKVFFEGRLKTDSWEDEAGIKHSRTKIIAENMFIHPNSVK